MTTLEFITALFCQVDDHLLGIPKHPHAKPTVWFYVISLVLRHEVARLIVQTPPDFVVKLQRLDIVDVIFRLVLRPHVVYQREIKG